MPISPCGPAARWPQPGLGARRAHLALCAGSAVGSIGSVHAVSTVRSGRTHFTLRTRRAHFALRASRSGCTIARRGHVVQGLLQRRNLVPQASNGLILGVHPGTQFFQARQGLLHALTQGIELGGVEGGLVVGNCASKRASTWATS